ncbi:alpha/beta fold hydrolase [Polymorphobacter sp.]|uniref:alpha/beta fold hydrolase n=1 Tax=Polymorphobacter sp. TaxID=1909290 RepID=UPI003F709CA2
MTGSGGQKPPLVFIHGMWSTPAAFARVRAALEARGWETHAPALPFHDRDPSLPPPLELGRITIEDYVQALAGGIARLGTPPVLIGHSMGGMLAQILASRLPHAGLILLATGATADTQTFAIAPLRTMASTIARWGWWEEPTRIAPSAARWGIYNEVPESVAAAEIAAHVWDSGRVLAEMVLPGLSKTGATRVDGRRLSRPALIVIGEEDRITPPAISRATARMLAGPVDYHALSGVGHWLFWGDPEARVTALIADWLDRLPT